MNHYTALCCQENHACCFALFRRSTCFLKPFTVVGFNLISGEPAFFPSCLDAVESDFVVSALTLFSSESTLSTSLLQKKSRNRPGPVLLGVC